MSANTLSPEEKFRVVLLGAAQSGKTELCCAMLGREPPARYTRTVEDLSSTDLGHISLQILDTAGSFAFPAMRRLEINSADAIVIVHRADLPTTAKLACDIAREVRSVRDNPPPLLLVRNTILVDDIEEGSEDDSCVTGMAKGEACITANVRSEGRRVLMELLQQAQNHEELFDRATEMAYVLTQIKLHKSGRRGSHQGGHHHHHHHHHHHRLSAIAHDLKCLFRRRSH